MKLSVYPTPNTHYQRVTKNYPYLIRILSVSHPHLIRHQSLVLSEKHKEYMRLCVRCQRMTLPLPVNAILTMPKHHIYDT